MNQDEKFIDRTFELAVRGKGFVSPNPMVSSVIVRDNTIISEGWHEKFGCSHAEVNAIANAEVDLAGATLYVNLAPCCHQGKTGPCTQAIIDAGISRVVYSNSDPNPLVADKSDSALRQAGIEVEGGVLQERGYQLNKKYFEWIQTGRPYVTLKVALTLDGKIATNKFQSKWITSNSARNYVYELRRGYDAVLVGANTVLQDNPNLGLHGAEGRDPHRIILTSTPSKFDVLRDLDVFRDDNYAFVSDLSEFEEYCRDNQISSVLVEGGAGVFTSFIKSGLVNDLFMFYGPKILGNEHLSAFSDLGLPTLQDAYKFNIASVSSFGESFMVKLEK